MVKIQNINKQLYRNGDTDDIINVVMMAYDIESDPQIKQIALELKGKNVYQTCNNIWNYLIRNVRYVADQGSQKIKTPARLIHDGVGDCKSYSLFTAVVLRFLGIDHVFRFVSYTKRKEATHVYVVAFPSHKGEGAGGEVIIDAVSAVQAKIPFGEEIKYTWKCDMSKGTEIYYMAGIPASRNIKKGAKNKIGSVNDYSIWLGNENPNQITPGKAWLYGQYDLISEMIGISTGKKESDHLYSQLSIITAFIAGYNYVNGNNEQFEKITRIISGLIRDNRFDISGISEGKRSNWFDALIYNITSAYDVNALIDSYDSNWYNLIVSKVINDNELTDSVNGIGSLDLLAPTLKKAGIYFLYTFIPDNELSVYDPKVSKKRATQLVFLNLIDKIDIFHKRETLIDFFRSGIIARVGMQPEEYIKSIKNNNVKIATLAVTLATIGAIISIVLGLLELIKAIWPNSEASKYAVSSGAADLNNELYTKQSGSGTGTGTGTNNNAEPKKNTLSASMPWLLGGSLLLTLLIKNKN